MGVKEKAEENKIAADLLYNENLTNAAISRYYYSAYQYLLELNNKKLGYTVNKGSSTSHEDLFKHTEDFLSNFQSNNYKSYAKANAITSLIRNIKKQRVIADYEEKNSDANHTKEKYKQFKIALGEFNNILK
ncbi:hypothetical protein I6G41_08205 [Staphylococcus equorum]|uniref:hypothetical protein n=1 Tax=Staphylococcus equorum TaxID=246432 RepID=UPI0018D7B498|nr:hypothetical protein [Staphylococcus equorum]QPS98495.1 hypothetical protein I6G41_08205 [Staphylococcus equorum]